MLIGLLPAGGEEPTSGTPRPSQRSQEGGRKKAIQASVALRSEFSSRQPAAARR